MKLLTRIAKNMRAAKRAKLRQTKRKNAEIEVLKWLARKQPRVGMQDRDSVDSDRVGLRLACYNENVKPWYQSTVQRLIKEGVIEAVPIEDWQREKCAGGWLRDYRKVELRLLP